MSVLPTGRGWLSRTSAALVVGAILAASLLACQHQRRQRLRSVDERIVTEVEQVLVSMLRGLPETDAIMQRYGRFINLTDACWDRPRYAWQLVERLDFSATAHFERAQASVTLPIDRGEAIAIDRLEMHPSAEFARGGKLVLIDHEFWLQMDDGRARCTLDGWARHPDFRHR